MIGGAALALVPRGFQDRNPHPPVSGAASRDYGALVRTPAFLIIFGAMLLCNLHFTMQTTQLKLIVLELGVDSDTGSAMISSFAVGVIVGRIACGVALDRFSPRLVASVCFLIPSVGLALLAAGVGNVALIAFAVMSLGFSVGAEGDIAAYLVMRYFGAELFSTVLGLVASAMAISALVGALVLSRTLAATGHYSLFIGIAATTMALGAASFLLLKPSPAHAAPEPVTPRAADLAH